jgi:hypothetical protein
MGSMGDRRALEPGRRRRRREEAGAGGPPRFWGRIGAYDAVTRDGVLYLLSPEPIHPSRRVRNAS